MLTPAQQQALVADIAADPVFSLLPKNGDSAFNIALEYNKDAPAPFIVWRTSVTWDEIMLNGMAWDRVDNLSVGKARIWDWLFRNSQNSMNPSKANIRAGIDAAWVGTAADLTVRASVYTHCKRQATRFERIFATGTGTTADPATLVIEFPVSGSDIEAAWSATA